MTLALSLLATVSALLTIRAEYRGPRLHVYVFKPLTVVLIILIALQAKHEAAASYGWLVVLGLVCSLIGDVFLMLPRERFLAGLLSFLFAHLFYTAAFTRDGLHARWWAAAVFTVYGVWMLMLLWPGLGKLKAPVVVYVTIILFMGLQASGRWLDVRGWGSAAACAGALLFVASDSALAWDRFRREFGAAQAVILSTYFAAQCLIALSV